jgi:hypothetical protein
MFNLSESEPDRIALVGTVKNLADDLISALTQEQALDIEIADFVAEQRGKFMASIEVDDTKAAASTFDTWFLEETYAAIFYKCDGAQFYYRGEPGLLDMRWCLEGITADGTTWETGYTVANTRHEALAAALDYLRVSA